MARERSVILDGQFQETKPKTVNKKGSNTMADNKLKEAKIALKEAKIGAAAAKRDVAEAQKVFMNEPTDADTGKVYRTAVAEHIKAAKALAKANAQVEKLAA
jgi:hypothetical protein